MTLLEALRALQAQRAEHVAAIEAIDRELAEARSLLLGTPVASTHVPDDGDVPFAGPMGPRACERCGEMFTPSTGSSGRWCSRDCYAGGLSIEERRVLVLDGLKNGPSYAALLRVGRLKNVSTGTLHNDLGALRRQGLVEKTGEGWRLVRSEPEHPPETVPLAMGQERTRAFPTLRLSNAS